MTVARLLKMAKFMIQFYLSLCVDYFMLDSLCNTNIKTEGPPTGMNLQFAPAYKVAMKDDNSCQNLFNLLMCIFLI